MADYEMREGQGTLFKRKVAEGSNAPTVSGEMMWNGEKLRIAGWPAKRKDGTLILDREGNPIVNIKISKDDFRPGQGGKPPRKARDEESVF